MAKIYDLFTKNLIADVPKFYFVPVKDEVLKAQGPLTTEERNVIIQSIKESELIIDKVCSDTDLDIIDQHDHYINRCEHRLALAEKYQTRRVKKTKRAAKAKEA